MDAEAMTVADETETIPTLTGAALEHAPQAPDALEQALRNARGQSLASREILLSLGREGDVSRQILDSIIDRAVRLCCAEAGGVQGLLRGGRP